MKIALKTIFLYTGTRFHILKSNFAVFPTTRLSKLVRARTDEDILRLCDGYSDNSNNRGREYFFNRNWASFNCILDMYR